MTLEEFEMILGMVSKLCDESCTDVRRKQRIENGMIKLWNEYRELKDKEES